MNDETKSDTVSTWRRMVPSAIAGAVASIFLLNTWWSMFRVAVWNEFAASQAVAVAVGGIYLCVAIAVLVAALSPWLGTKYVQPEETEDLLRQRGYLFGVSATAFAFGTALCLLASEAQFLSLAPTWLAGGLFAIGSISAFLAWRLADELKRRIAGDAALIEFCVVAMIAMGWAVLAQGGVVGTAAQIDWISVIFATGLFSLIASATMRGSIKWW